MTMSMSVGYTPLEESIVLVRLMRFVADATRAPGVSVQSGD